jgi:hypothetical protein
MPRRQYAISSGRVVLRADAHRIRCAMLNLSTGTLPSKIFSAIPKQRQIDFASLSLSSIMIQSLE